MKHDKELKVVTVEKEVKPIVSRFTVGIVDAKTMNLAVSALSQLNKILDRITEEKEKLTIPLNAALKEIRGRYKGAEDELKQNIENIREMMSAYQTQKIREEREAENKIADRIGEGKGKIKMETAARKMDEIDRVDTQVISGEGMVKFKTVQKLKITDYTLIPEDFWIVNEKMLFEALKGGGVIAGAEIEEIQVPLNYRG